MNSVEPTPIERANTWKSFEEKFKAKVDTSVLQHVFESTLEHQKNLQNNQAMRVEGSLNFPYDVVIRKNNFQVLLKKAGEGTYSNVFKETFFPTKHTENHSPSKPQKMAIKIAKTVQNQYSPEKRRLQKIDPSNCPEIDHFIETFKISNGIPCSLHKYYKTNIHSLNYNEIKEPTKFLVKVLLDVANGIRKIHQRKYVHRDIKGANILVEKTGGAITDFGLLAFQTGGKHQTAGTCAYLDPKVFGDPEESVLFQKYRWGTQTIESDIFSFGRTIERDALKILLIHLSVVAHVEEKIRLILQKLEPEVRVGPFSDEYLKNIGKEYPYLVTYFHANKNFPERLWIMKDLSLRLKIFEEAIDVLKKHISDEDMTTLQSLAQLSLKLQEKNTLKMNADKVYEFLIQLPHSDMKVPLSITSKQPKKRALEEIFSEDPLKGPTQVCTSDGEVLSPAKRQKKGV